jgi:hypothetical protein
MLSALRLLLKRRPAIVYRVYYPGKGLDLHVARCECGWQGERTHDLAQANREADAHRH